MRIIGTIDDKGLALIFSKFLTSKGISHQLEVVAEQDWGSPNYGLIQTKFWIENEDQLEDALKWFAQFKENPYDPFFKVESKEKITLFNSPFKATPPPLPSSSEQSRQKNSNQTSLSNMGPITRFILLACCLLFLLSQLITASPPVPKDFPGKPIFSSPVEKVILFDYPYAYELIERLIKLYGYEKLQNPKDLPPEGTILLNKINHTPYWQGLYSIIIEKGFSAIPEKIHDTPMFEKIKQGEWWRLLSPIFFHADIFHIFFNMLWLIVLGKQIEQKVGTIRYILFVLIIGILSNFSQYLMSGPNFVGFSGVLCGMLTFIWVRQKKAPWEGYQLDRTTIIFMLLFIFSMAAIQFFSFILEKSFDVNISPGIANVAHLSGAFLGLILGSINLFSRRLAK